MSDFSLEITRLSEPAGGHATKAYGRGTVSSFLQEGPPKDDGFVYLDHENGWLTVRYSPFNHGLPLGGGQTVYRAYEERSVFGATPSQLDAILPDYISVPSTYEQFPSEESRAFHAIWHGTRFERRPRGDPAESANLTKFFVDEGTPGLSDDEWEQVEQWDAIVDAAEAGYEDKQTARNIVGDAYYDAACNDDSARYKHVEL